MVAPSMDLQSWLRKQVEESDPDLLREIVQAMAEALMSADADTVCNAPYGERSEDRTNRRNGQVPRTGQQCQKHPSTYTATRAFLNTMPARRRTRRIGA